MTTLHHVLKARKDNKAHGIKKGDSYYWWAHRIGRSSSKHYSLTRPKPSQLTTSDFLANVYSAQEGVEEALDKLENKPDKTTWDLLMAAVEDAKNDMKNESGECQGKFQNMPEGLQAGPTGQLLEEREQWCDQMAQDLDSALEIITDQDNPSAWEGIEFFNTVEGLDWSSAP